MFVLLGVFGCTLLFVLGCGFLLVFELERVALLLLLFVFGELTLGLEFDELAELRLPTLVLFLFIVEDEFLFDDERFKLVLILPRLPVL